jgi:hypothetical protein
MRMHYPPENESLMGANERAATTQGRPVLQYPSLRSNNYPKKEEETAMNASSIRQRMYTGGYLTILASNINCLTGFSCDGY